MGERARGERGGGGRRREKAISENRGRQLVKG